MLFSVELGVSTGHEWWPEPRGDNSSRENVSSYVMVSRKYRIKKRGSPIKDYVIDATQENEMTLNVLSQIDRFS